MGPLFRVYRISSRENPTQALSSTRFTASASSGVDSVFRIGVRRRMCLYSVEVCQLSLARGSVAPWIMMYAKDGECSRGGDGSGV